MTEIDGRPNGRSAPRAHPHGPVAVPIIAGTAIRGVAASVMMRPVLERHPNAFLITLANFGVTLPLRHSQAHIAHDIEQGLLRQGRDPDSPIVLVGHSQGGLAVLRYAVDHPQQVQHVFSIGSPWHGARSARTVTRLVGKRIVPGLRDMVEGSTFLQDLHHRLPDVAHKVTNIYSTHEIFIRPYVAAHIEVPGVKNVLIATHSEHRRHMLMYPGLTIDDVIIGRVNHLSEMQSPEVRSRVWAMVETVSASYPSA